MKNWRISWRLSIRNETLVEFSGESELQEEDDDWSRDLTSSLERGANVAGFLKVVSAMKDLGWL